tara:strand:- start:2461 stop:2820 length:360 start_codon:yes stop_codon:yes gene_type:complete
MKLFWISSLLILIFACGEQKNEVPSNLISGDALVPLLADFHLMDAAAKQNIITNNHKTLVKHQQYAGVLKKHGVSRAQFDSTIQFYVQSPDVFKILYDKVGTYLKLEKEKQEEKIKLKK